MLAASNPSCSIPATRQNATRDVPDRPPDRLLYYSFPVGCWRDGRSLYRAHDTRLGRDVAIKILPAVWLIDAERRARFDREARTLASLNHPHIAAIYDLEDVDDSRALVLELVEGPTLADVSATARCRSKKRC